VLNKEFGAPLRAWARARGCCGSFVEGGRTPVAKPNFKKSDRNMFSLSRFGELLKYLPRGAFKKIVEKHKADRYVKRFGCEQQLLAMLYAHMSEARSLRALETGLNQHCHHRYHLGIGKISRSTLAGANETRKPVVFEELLRLLMQTAGRSVRKQRDEMLYLLDSTCIRWPGAAWNGPASWQPVFPG
jgi:hypothetical protein